MEFDINKALEQLAKAFNVAVDELYPILYKQAIINGIFSLGWALLFIGLIGLFISTIRLIVKKQKEEEDTANWDWDWDEPRQIAILVVGITVTIIGFFVVPIALKSSATALLNPDYYMLKEILKQLK